MFYPVAPLPDTNSRQVAQTIRMPSTALLTIDSEDRHTNYEDARFSNVSPYNFTISKTESLMSGFITRIGVSEVVFPWAVPNINPKTCTINYTYTIDGTPTNGTLTLAQGFYNPGQLATAIQQGFPGPLGFTMTYGTGNKPAFFYSVGDGNTIAFQPMVYNSPAFGGTPAYPYPDTTKQLFDLLGFADGNTEQVEAGSGGYTLCQPIRYVDFVCNQLTNSQAQKDQTSQTVARDMLCRLYLATAPGQTSTIGPNVTGFCPPGCAPTILYANFNTPKQIQWIPNQNIPGFLQFQVYDDTGQLLDGSFPAVNLGRYLDWSMTMLVSES